MLLSELVVCASCRQTLVNPTTLSCGYTVCQSCLPANAPSMAIFTCPVGVCNQKTHLFGPEILPDVLVETLCDVVKQASHVNDDFYQCNVCHHTLADPITAHCGHTYCRKCFIQSKIIANLCPTCHRPLPMIEALQRQPSNSLIDTLVTCRQSGTLTNKMPDATTLEDQSGLPVPLFHISTGAAILPSQRVRLVIAKSQLDQFLRCLIPVQSQRKKICIAAVHRLPAKQLVGVYAEILDVQHCATTNTVNIKVIGRERFQIMTTDSPTDLQAASAVVRLLQDDMKEGEQGVGSLTEREKDNEKCVALASEVYDYIVKLARPGANPLELSSDTSGILGPAWLANAENIHGPLPLPTSPSALGWWAANVLPLDVNQRYTFTRTFQLADRLDLLRIWVLQLQEQWTRCRTAAIDTIIQTFGTVN